MPGFYPGILLFLKKLNKAPTEFFNSGITF